MVVLYILTREQAINILFCVIDTMVDKSKCSDNTNKLIDEAREYILRNLK